MFGQLCRLRQGDNILAKHATHVFSTGSASSKSWFWKVRGLCMQYDLPHPASWLSIQPSKQQVKSVTKAAVLKYWLDKIRLDAANLPSLKYLKTGFLGLTRCHPLFLTCGSSPWEVEKATTQARLLSGRYRLEELTCHWVPWNRGGMCSLPDCWGTTSAHRGTVEAFLLTCSSLSSTRLSLATWNTSFLQINPQLECLVIL